MNLQRRRVLAFALAFIPPFVVAVWLYPSILPTYQRAVLASVNSFLAILSPVAEIRAVLAGRWQILVHRPNASGIVTYTLGSANIGLLTFFQLVVLSALLLATPVKLKERLRLFAYGIGVMFVFHLLCIAGCAYGMALIDNSKNVTFRSLPIILGPFASGLAVIVWSLLTWRYWLAAPEAPELWNASEAVGRKPRHRSGNYAGRKARPRHQS